MNRLILGTRASPLALAQAHLTRDALSLAFPGLEVELKTFTTRGDQKLDLNLLQKSEAGGKGLFTKELEEALLAGGIDVAVHSLKDLPGHNPPGLALTAVLPRAATGDVLIATDAPELDSLPVGARLGTSSIRRARQVRWLRPDLRVEEWRGNVQTRLRKLGESSEVAGILLAQAGLERLGFDLSGGTLGFEKWQFRVCSLEDKMFPAIGQGAIALQSCIERAEVTSVLRSIHHEPTAICIRAERALQALLSGDCSLPVGVRAQLRAESGDSGAPWLEMRAILFGAEDRPPAQAHASGAASDPEAVAAEVFSQLERAAHPAH